MSNTDRHLPRPYSVPKGLFTDCIPKVGKHSCVKPVVGMDDKILKRKLMLNVLNKS